MEPVKIFVPGQPQGKARARSRIVTNKTTGKQFTSHYTPANTRDYENRIAVQATRAMIGRERIEGPVKLSMLFLFEIPASWPQWKQKLAFQGEMAPTVKPDSDNIEKAIKDALNQIVWGDDCQVVITTKTKRYSDRPGVYAVIESVDKFPSQLTKNPGSNKNDLNLEVTL
jgi:Holliday junction resolvase RusA-like endonuclease